MHVLSPSPAHIDSVLISGSEPLCCSILAVLVVVQFLLLSCEFGSCKTFHGYNFYMPCRFLMFPLTETLKEKQL